MKQMTLIEMDGFLKGKCIPRDLKVNETNAEYLVRKFGEIESKIALLEVQLKLSEAAERAWESSMMQACGEDGPKSVADKFAELESKLETALRECRSAGITIDNLEAKCAALAEENAKLKKFCKDAAFDADYEAELGMERGGFSDAINEIKTPATDAFLAEVRAQGVEMFAASLKVVGGHEHPYSSLAHEFAAQLRKGGNK
ncbi:hypothetical protein CG692_14205 [Escherichia coli]|uniref:hypothetical protein n=1 Tax=Escherichia coli TaxID=562 RepID=UPI000CBE2457|nr:hypothetical protein [Escherichia coli]OZP07479.1 hypothetical protein CG692_14205 [Escherichia coli]HAY4652200.1 hypothetical protein [Escherichia coli]